MFDDITSPPTFPKEARHLDFGMADDPDPCPACGGEPVLLGSLGRTPHLRCRNCGWTWGVTA